MEKGYVLQLRNGNFRNLSLKFCGYSECEPLHSFGPASRPVYIIHIILEGKGIYVVDNKKYELDKGEAFIIEPNIVTFYQANSKEPWSYCWIAFDGEDSEKLLQEIGLNQQKPIFKTDRGIELFEIIKEMLKKQTNNLVNQLELQALFFKFFALMLEGKSVEHVEQNEKLSCYVYKAIDFIKKNYWDDINVNSVVEYVGLNRSYISSLFHKEVGITIKEYISVFRLSRANELLDITDESIEEVAYNSGYKDPLIFTKAYKKKYGVTPTQHRKIDRKKIKEDLEKFKLF